jgi:hypothetical protein
MAGVAVARELLKMPALEPVAALGPGEVDAGLLPQLARGGGIQAFIRLNEAARQREPADVRIDAASDQQNGEVVLPDRQYYEIYGNRGWRILGRFVSAHGPQPSS